MFATNIPQQLPTRNHNNNTKSCLAASTGTSPTSRTAMPKRVTFNPMARLHRVCCIHELLSSANQTADALWYGSNEYRAFKARDMKIVQQMMKTKNEQPDGGDSSRGLESYTPRGSQRKRHARIEACTAVLEEQHRQYIKGEDYSPAKIAAQCERLSTRAAWTAYKMALKDEQNVRMLLQGEEQRSSAVASQSKRNIRMEPSCPPGTTDSPRQYVAMLTLAPKRRGGIA
jgi:hypothetical protein